MRTEFFGKTKEGKDATSYFLSNKNNMEIVVTDFGAILLNVFIPGKNGEKTDIVLGCDCFESYYDNSNFFGSTVGPIANRTAGAKATIDGIEYSLDQNDGENNLHTCIPAGMNKRLWEAKENGQSITFSMKLKDMEYGLPGNRSFHVTYTLTDENEIKISYQAKSDKATIFNMTNHSYFNLTGTGSGKILDHEVTLHASAYTPVVPGAIPTGEIETVTGTPLDFTKKRRIGDEIDADFEQLKLVRGYDHNFVTDHYDGTVREIAQVTVPGGKTDMKVFTDLPGVQLYTGNFIEHTKGKNNVVYEIRDGLCLETQYYPDSIHHSNFPSEVFGPETEYHTTTIYQFEFCDK